MDWFILEVGNLSEYLVYEVKTLGNGNKQVIKVSSDGYGKAAQDSFDKSVYQINKVTKIDDPTKKYRKAAKKIAAHKNYSGPIIESEGSPSFGSNDQFDAQVDEVERAAKVFDTVAGMRVGSSLKVAGEVYRVTSEAKGMGEGKKWLQIGDELGHQFVMVMPYDQSYVTLHSPGRTSAEPSVVPVQQIEWLADEVNSGVTSDSVEESDGGNSEIQEGILKKIKQKVKNVVSPQHKALLKKLKSTPGVRDPEALASYIGKRLGGLASEDDLSMAIEALSVVSKTDGGAYAVEGIERSFRTHEGALNHAFRTIEESKACDGMRKNDSDLLEGSRSVVDTYGLDEFDYGELSFTGKHTRKYKKGQKVMILDKTGYHDATVTVVSTEIILDADDNRKYLAVKDRSGNVDLEPLTRRGFLKGDTKSESVEFLEASKMSHRGALEKSAKLYTDIGAMKAHLGKEKRPIARALMAIKALKIADNPRGRFGLEKSDTKEVESYLSKYVSKSIAGFSNLVGEAKKLKKQGLTGQEVRAQLSDKFKDIDVDNLPYEWFE